MTKLFTLHRLPNGLRVILIPRPESLATTVLILVKAGSEYEVKKQNGISHFLEHMMFKGTTKRPKSAIISEELDRLGAQYNAFTSKEYTGYFAKAENHKLPQIFDIMSDLYLNPIFEAAEIEKERGVVIEEINMYEDMPMRTVQEVFEETLYGDQPAGWTIAGKKETIRRLAREEFMAYRDARYVASGTVVIVAGGFRKEKALEQAKALFSHLPKRRSPAKKSTHDRQTSPRCLVKFKESDQGHLVLGVHGLNLFDPRRYALHVLSDLLGGGMSSRLFKRIREELGAAYYIRSDADFSLDHGDFTVSAGVDIKKIELVIRAIVEEFRLVRDIPVGAPELQKTKDHLIGGIIMGLETSDEIAGFYGTQELLSDKIVPPEEIIKKIKAVTSEEVQKVSRDLLKAQKLNLAIIGPYKSAKPFEKLLKL